MSDGEFGEFDSQHEGEEPKKGKMKGGNYMKSYEIIEIPPDANLGVEIRRGVIRLTDKEHAQFLDFLGHSPILFIREDERGQIT